MPNIDAMLSDPDFLELTDDEQASVLEIALKNRGEAQQTFFQKTEPYVRPVLEYVPAIGGSVIGSGLGPFGTLAGGSLGYAGGKELADLVYDRNPETFTDQLKEVGQDLKTGAIMEMAGPLVVKGVSGLSKGVGAIAKPSLGSLTGSGEGMVEQALKGGKQFTSAMRGKITPEEIVGNANIALNKIKDARGIEYRNQLDKIQMMPEKLNAIKKSVAKRINNLIGKKNFNIKPVVTEAGVDFDMSKSSLVKNQDVIKKALQDVSGWDDFTASGYDTLKKRVATYANQVEKGSPQETFLKGIQNSISDGLKKNVPGYAKMTKGYQEATELIKDIESGLMMRKQGMTGRVTADQTLRRLNSAMRESFELRKDLVRLLSKESGDDILAQVGGYAASPVLPRGLVGKLAGGGAGIAATQISPWFAPMLTASSPRLSGEFLNLLGSGARMLKRSTVGKTLGKTKPAAIKALGYSIGKAQEE